MDLRKSPDIEQRAINAVKTRTPQSTDHRVSGVQQKFLDGVLYTVGFLVPDGDPNGYHNRVYVTKNTIEAYGTDDFLLQVVGARHARSFYDIFANGDVVSGIIALVVTVMIVPSFIVSYFSATHVDVPDWITSGWLLILGFYFGKASGRAE
ncbi:hypothetical protein ACC699_13645 [Rhizobium ruizarguesonis]